MGFDFPKIFGRSHELLRGDNRRTAPGWVSPRREVHFQNLRRRSLCEATRQEELWNKIERRCECAPDRAAHEPAEDANPKFAIQRPRKRVADNQPMQELRTPASQPKP